MGMKKKEMIETVKTFKEMTSMEKKKLAASLIIVTVVQFACFIVGSKASCKASEIVDDMLKDENGEYVCSSNKVLAAEIIAGGLTSIVTGLAIGKLGAAIIKRINR